MFVPAALLTILPFAAGPQESLPSANPSAAAADALAAEFDEHQFVFIGSTHGDAKIEEFLIGLLARPAFRQRVTDIVVEWASSGHQRLLDRYVLALESIPAEELAPIWFDTDYPPLWATLPQIRQFLDALRETNKALRAEKRIRLVGGSEGIDWTKVKAVEDLAPYPYKTNWMPHLLLEHLAKAPENRTLVVYGDGHIRYGGNNFMGELEAGLGRAGMFVVGTVRDLHAGERAWVAKMGDPEKPFFVEAGRFPEGAWPESLRTSLQETSSRLADYVDGLLYLGPETDRSLIGALPLTDEQKKELDRRSQITSDFKRTMQARFGGRERWFAAHPDDLPPRP